MYGQLADVINQAKFYLNRLMGYAHEELEICLTPLT